MSSVNVATWDVDAVTSWLAELKLDAVLPAFKANAVDGADLLNLSEQELKEELGCTTLQVRKIKGGLAKLAGEGPSAPAPARPSNPEAATSATKGPLATPVLEASQTKYPPLNPPPTSQGVALGVPMTSPGGEQCTPPTPLHEAPSPPAPAIPPADRTRYQELSSRIQRLEALRPSAMLAQAQHSAQGAGSAVQAATKALPALEKALAAAQEELKEKETSWYPGKKLLGEKKHQEKLAEHQKAVDEAQKKCDMQRLRLEEAQAALAEARNVAAAWQGKVSELDATKREREQLVAGIFSSDDWAAQGPLVSLKAAEAELRGQEAKAQQTASIYGRAQGLMQGAAQKIEGALQALGRTQMSGMMQMGMGVGRPLRGRHGPMNLMMDMGQMMSVRQANEMVQSAARDITAARGVLPTMPSIDEALLKSATMGIFQNVLFGGVMSDMMQIAMVKRSTEEVKRMMGQVKQVLGWIGSNLAAFQGQAAQHKAAADAKAAEAAAFKRSQLEAT